MGAMRVTYARDTLSQIGDSESVCYFLGAGFSTACDPKYPVAHGFLGRRFGEVELFPHFLRKPSHASASADAQSLGLLGRLEEQYGPLSKVNIEDVMTDLHVRAFGLGRAWEMTQTYGGAGDSTGQCARDYDELLDFIEASLFSLGKDNRNLDTASTLVQALLSQDSIVSLNYDTIIEHRLKTLNPKNKRQQNLFRAIGPLTIGFGQAAPDVFGIYDRLSDGILAKLHGSIDWYACANENCTSRAYIVPGWLSDDHSILTHGGARCHMCGSGVKVAIIPPTLTKPFERFPKMGIVWLLAFTALRWAQRWVFIGTSLAPTDFHLASLLRSASESGYGFSGRQICIVDNSYDCAKDVANRFMRYLSPAAARHFEANGESITLFSSVKTYFEEVKRVDSNRAPDTVDEGTGRAGGL